MIYQKLASIVTAKRNDILKLWVEDFKKTRTLRVSEGVDETKYKRLMQSVLEGFDEMISKNVSKYRICLDFTQLGHEFYKDQYAIHDIINALTLLKKVIIEVVHAEGFFSTAYQLYQLQELNNRAVLYFDRALYYSTLGYEESLKDALNEAGFVGKIKKFMGSSDARKKHLEACIVELEK